MKDDGGWTRSYRRKWRNPVFLNFRDAAVWSYLIDNAAWQDDTDIRFEGHHVRLMAGQIAVSERFLAEGFACDRQVIRRIFGALEKNLMTTREKTHGISIITICNYRLYQASEEEEKPAAAPGKTQREPSENPKIKESNELKKEEVVVVSRERLREVGLAVMEIMKVDEARWTGNYALAEVWMKKGFDPELDIYPTIRRVMAGWRNRDPPRSFAFFDAAIAQTYANRHRTIAEQLPNDGAKNGNFRPRKPTGEDRIKAMLGASALRGEPIDITPGGAS